MTETNVEVTERAPITCRKCGSLNWTCFDEQTRDCWDSKGNHVGYRVIGMLRCGDCGHVGEHYSVDAALDNPDCECGEY